MLTDATPHRSSIAPYEAPLAHVPGSVYFWWAFFALGVVALGSGLWGLVWRRVRRRRLRADLAQWPSQADRAVQARFLIELVRHHRLKPAAEWVEAVDQAGQSEVCTDHGDDSDLNPLLALRDAVHEMEYVD